MNKKRGNKGVTLIALIVIIIILIILTGVAVYFFSENGPIEKAKMAKFMTEFREIEEKVELYAGNKLIQQTIEETQNGSIQTNQILPVAEKLTSEEKTTIKNKKPELATKIMQLSEKEVSEVNLYWIDQKKIEANKRERYLIDAETRQIYQYEGQTIYGLKWHTLDSGVEKGELKEEKEELWDGWIRLTLYYPAGSTDRQWRLGEEGETRYDQNLMWQDYVEPIWVKISEVENVWIRYKLNGEEHVVAPSGRLAVDIEPDTYLPKLVQSVKVKIYYEKDAEVKEYKIGNSNWMEYAGEFIVTENTIIEARAKKVINISDNDGNIIAQQEIWGRDNVYIGNIGIEESDLPAPTLTRKEADSNVEGEVAKVEAIYPEEATKKIYKINYGEEKEYTEDISIKSYGTHIIAYYYNSEGKRSKGVQILINDTRNGEQPESAQEYTPNPSGKPQSGEIGSNPTEPSYKIEKPIISVTPVTVANSVIVKIEQPTGQTVDKIYYKIADENYQEYTIPFTLNNNTIITAYYVTLKGERSSIARKRINNIQVLGMPYVKLEADPDSYDIKNGVDKVTVTITAQDADKIEYSMNGVIYQSYTGPFEVTTNTRVYARGTNNQGETIEYIDITNIGEVTSGPTKQERLSVWIEVNPEPKLTSELVEKVQVTIGYDEKAQNKYYKIDDGELLEYLEPFEVTKNCTIYAYAESNNGVGKTSKQIDNLTTGISKPEIVANPSNNKQSSHTTITINFDRSANITRYKINNGTYTDYTGPIDITENCTITAYNKNKLGYEATSTYTINNIIKTTTIVIDKGKYILIKLNYPPEATGKEYKWQDDGVWTSYKEDGILLIKPEYKDEILNAEGNLKIKIENEEGKQIDFKGDYYFVTKSISELVEHIYLRWSRTTPQIPTIVLNTEEPAKEVKVGISYSDVLKVKQYKIIEPDGTSDDWKEYTGAFTITKKNTIIYARGQDEAEVWTEQSMRKITNIDEEPPIIKVTADLENMTQKVGIKVEVQDDTKIETIAWAQGIRTDSYFDTNGTVIQNNSVFYVTENNYYTIYAKDGVGNTSTYTLQVGNVDLTPPIINIVVTPEDTISTEVKINIDYGDSTLKQYKIGESNTTWTTYTGEISLTSNTVLANNWKNDDNTVTIYAKGKDSVGNEQIVTYKLLNLDVDEPITPTITSNYGYPILTEYGVQFDGETTITYDTRTDIDNYYSIDNGTTWQKYTGTFNLAGTGNIIAKSIKKSSGLEVIASKTISMPSNALGPSAYDGNTSTYANLKDNNNTTKILKIDANMQGRNVIIKYPGQAILYFKDSSGTKTKYKYGSYNNSNVVDHIITLPQDIVELYFESYNCSTIYEITVGNDTVVHANKYYPNLTQYGVEAGYNTVTLEYFPTSVQKLYKIDNDDWKAYQGETIRLEIGQIIYAKGIDKNGNETRTVSSYTSSLPNNALGAEAYDGNTSTYANLKDNDNTTKILKIDANMQGRKITIRYPKQAKFYFKDSSGTKTEYKYGSYNNSNVVDHIITLPQDIVELYFESYNCSTIYEITV